MATTTLLPRIQEFATDLDTIVPISDPLLWATYCSLDAAVLLLQAYVCSAADEDRHRKAVLDAIAAARASVAAATFAAQTTMQVATRTRRSTQMINSPRGDNQPC